MGIQITPLASLCLGVVRGWIRVAEKGKGGQRDEQGTAWTRLPADQLRDQLEREFMVETSTRSIHRALKELTEANLLRRQQRWKHRYRRDYWYSIPSYEEELQSYLPRSIDAKHKAERNRSKEQNEVTPVSGQVLPTPIIYKNQFSLNQQPNQNQKTKRRNTISDAINACNAKGNRPRRPIPVGFGGNNEPSRPPNPIGTDHMGRPLSEVWVNGTKHLVVD